MILYTSESGEAIAGHMKRRKQNPDTADLIATVLLSNFSFVYLSISYAISNADSGRYL